MNWPLLIALLAIYVVLMLIFFSIRTLIGLVNEIRALTSRDFWLRHDDGDRSFKGYGEAKK